LNRIIDPGDSIRGVALFGTDPTGTDRS